MSESDEIKPTIEIYSLVNELYCKTIVTQKLLNKFDNPLELQIFLNNSNKYILTSFTAKIGDSIEVRSKLIKETKAEEKYTDSISSGNAAIYVSYDIYDSRYIVNMGNIPPKQELIFTSEYIQYIESSDFYELELFRNLPIFMSEDEELQNSEIKGTIEIKTNYQIKKITNIILSKKLKITEEKYTNENNCEYLIKYEYKDLPKLSLRNSHNYIPSNKILFEIDNKDPITFYQKSPKNNEINYVIQYRNIPKVINEENESDINPSLFFFLLDQSYSMEGHSMDVAIKALILFLQSLPAGSYYQIIGFGSKYEKYDKIPKSYTQENIKESIKFLQTLKANKGTTDIFSPLKDIYESRDYHHIKLPRNIFLLTDGEIDNKNDTLNLIEKYSNEFTIHAIGIGKDFDKDLIKNAGILGKGNFNFCSDINYLKQTIIKEIKNSSKQFYYNCELTSNLDEKNLFKVENNKTIPVLRENQIVNMKYIIEDTKDENEVKLNLKYFKSYEKEQKEDEINENLETKKIELPEGNELSQLIIDEYLKNIGKQLDKEEKTKLALKYQILTDETSLFAEIKLSDKITEEMKKEIIGKNDNNEIPKTYYYDKYEKYEEKDDNFIKQNKNNEYEDIFESIKSNIAIAKNNLENMNKEARIQGNAYCSIGEILEREHSKQEVKKSGGISGFFKSVGKSIKGIFSKNKKNNNINEIKKSINSENNINTNNDNKTNIKTDTNIHINKNINNSNINNNINSNENNNNDNNNNNNLDEKKIDEADNNKMSEKNDNNNDDDDENTQEININKIVNEQNFVEGFWEINKRTEKVKEKYENEFKLLKELKDKNINDNIAITILIIYYINKEHAELLNELELIIQKAKKYIKKNINESYEDIIKELGL